MGFQRQIGYLTYYRREERQGNCGFLRLEQREETWRIRIQVQKLPMRQELSGRVVFVLQEGEWAPEEILLQNGQGVFEKKGTGANFGGIKGVCIRLGGAQELRWGKAGAEQRPEPEIGISAAQQTQGQERMHSESIWERKPEPEKGMPLEAILISDEDGKQEEGEKFDREEQPEENSSLERQPPEQEAVVSERQPSEEKPIGLEKPLGERGATPLAEEKWQQLNAIYPHRQPFGDERDYLAIGPSDFVVLTEESFRAANNSFLLHGYYCFGHLVLCRTRKKGETVSYIGVPGYYTDREKQAAILYGFESFESEAEPASEGDFGYYLLRVRF